MQKEIPEVIEEYLEVKDVLIKCIAFNRRGTLLAAGCSNGSCVIWDFETRVIAKELKDEDCTAAITSVCWSKYSHHLLVLASDKTLNLWDVATGIKVAQTILKITCLHAQLHPASSISSLCLITPIYSAPSILDLSTGNSMVLPISLSDWGKDSTSHIPSCFNKHGDLVYLGNCKGEILIIDLQSIQIRAVVSAAGGAGIKNVVFSRSGMYLLTNSSDRTIRVYKNTLPPNEGLKAICTMSEMLSDLRGIDKLKVIGTKSLVLCHEFQDSVCRTPWKAPCFSKNGEWIIGGSAGEREHKIYIWDNFGDLVKILNGPKEGLVNLAWHPVSPIVVSLSLTGLVYIWAKDYTEKWSAFFPDFKELEDIEEYVEREDEFDIMPETVPEIRKVQESDFNHDEEADIVSKENDALSSDSEMSEEELCFLPSVPCPDTPEQLVKCTADSQILADSKHYSWTSTEAGQDRLVNNHESNLIEGTNDCHDPTANVRHAARKRQRKPTEKLVELLCDMAMKAAKKKDWTNTTTRNFIE